MGDVKFGTNFGYDRLTDTHTAVLIELLLQLKINQNIILINIVSISRIFKFKINHSDTPMSDVRKD